MNIKEFFKLDWKVFVLFAVFNLLAGIGFLESGGVGGVHTGSGLFSIFGFFNQLKCADLSSASAACDTGGFVIGALVHLLNLAWQYFLACLAMFIVGKIKKK